MSVLAASSTASQVHPGLVGFLVVAGMGLALFFLFRSLNKQLHKIAPGQPIQRAAGPVPAAPPGARGVPRPAGQDVEQQPGEPGQPACAGPQRR